MSLNDFTIETTKKYHIITNKFNNSYTIYLNQYYFILLELFNYRINRNENFDYKPIVYYPVMFRGDSLLHIKEFREARIHVITTVDTDNVKFAGKICGFTQRNLRLDLYKTSISIYDLNPVEKLCFNEELRIYGLCGDPVEPRTLNEWSKEISALYCDLHNLSFDEYRYGARACCSKYYAKYYFSRFIEKDRNELVVSKLKNILCDYYGDLLRSYKKYDEDIITKFIDSFKANYKTYSVEDLSDITYCIESVERILKYRFEKFASNF